MVFSLIDRAIVRAAKSRRFAPWAVRATLRANELLGLAIGARLAELRDSGDGLARSFADAEANAIQARLFFEAAQILRERLDRIPERRRPHYRPDHRFRILRLSGLLALSLEETARWFRVSPGTIARWEREAATEGGAKEAGLVQPSPPVRRYADVVRSLVQSMALAGFGGQERIARILARAGWEISKRTVGRILRENRYPPASQPREDAPAGSPRAERPQHIVALDITEILGLFGLFRFKLALVLDLFSRMPLAWRAFHQEPSARDLASLLEAVSRRFGRPETLLTDRGPQFTGTTFHKLTRRLGIEHRFGAIGHSGSIAIIERLWRTLKQELGLHRLRPLTKAELDRRLALGLLHYAAFRPHTALEGATPLELFLGLTPPENDGVFPAPRARPREGPTHCPFTIRFLDEEGPTLPFLTRNAA